jgi:hypothetical protein
MSLLFAARHEFFLDMEGAYKAGSILTYIDRMDKSLFHDKKPRLRDTYEFLSEFVHPNHLGILGMYSDDYYDEGRIEFGKTVKKKELLLPNLAVALAMIWLVENAAADIDDLMPRLAEFVSK